jgi:drug/metabolite transporter (DMT)-like permease
MTLRIFVVLFGAAFLAALGQVLFKIGATGREQLSAFINPWIIAGLAAYALGTFFWIYSLSKATLTLVYPFTVLTFVLVYAFGTLVLHEPTTVKASAGVVLVLLGLFLIST